ncbi:glycosyltransferase family 2 protein [Rickettsiella endosymbiont of Dermanyssus gallinae]|uniref:glycosyltransferase family 2 protein n=1 Tax=Rickettsiella endosymbiont of Dermanyssus gallinae TaxID=2856608 RepID=UPI001C52B227|nr:glycosyltransferase family 2 protein [Rickettsiella endosymbiont of Dermanyssus gallinae]
MVPLFSIILTTYNRSQLLPRAIRSVLQQTFSDFELIIIDDHSTDNTQSVVAEFTDNRITYIQQDHNQGVSTARNTGIKQAKGEYLCFLDDDDEYLPAFLQEIFQCIEKKKKPFIGFIRVGIAKIFTSDNLEHKNATTKTQIWHLAQEKNLLFITKMDYVGLVYHRLCFKRAGIFNPEMIFAEDLDVVLRMLEANISYTSIPKVLLNMYIHQQSSLSRSISIPTIINAMQYFLYTNDKFLNQQLALWLYYYTSLAANYYRIGEKRLARKLVRSILKKCWHYPKIWDVFRRFELKLLKSRLVKSFTA